MSDSRTTAFYSGSFCPPTLGHLDVIERGAKLYERLIVAMLVNPDKRYRFSTQQRLEMLKKCTAHLPNVEILTDSGLLVEAAKRAGAGVILRGVRGSADLEYEMQMAAANRHLSGIETVFLPTSPELNWVSSSIVTACAMHGGNIRGMVPDVILEDVLQGYQE